MNFHFIKLNDQRKERQAHKSGDGSKSWRTFSNATSALNAKKSLKYLSLSADFVAAYGECN